MAKKSKKPSVKKKTTKEKKQSSSAKKSSGVHKKVKTTKGDRKKTIRTIPSKTSEKPSDNPIQSSSAKVSKPAKKRRKIKTYLKARDLVHFRTLLLEKLHQILGDVDWIENEALRKSRQDSTGDLSTMPIHMADLGTDNYEQEFSLGLMDSERKIVQEILAALKRITLETYGICEGTGQPIPRARLEANPWARYCVEYASLIEQGKAIEGGFYQKTVYASDTEGDEEEQEEDVESLDQEEDMEEDVDAFLYEDENEEEEEKEEEEEEEEEDEEEGEDKAYTEGLYYEEDHDDEDEELF